MNETEFQAGDSLENIFARALEAERENERYLVDDEWHITPPEPESDHESDPETATTPARNGAKPERPEPDTIFSWAEFMTQPAVPGKRRRKEPEAPYLFQWAVQQEREREQ